MTLKALGRGCGVAAVVLIGTMASAQTLADVARTEESRRKTVKEPAKVYTNDDLKRAPGDNGQMSTPAPAATETPAPAADAPKDAAKTDDTKSNEPKDQAYWKDRITKARDQLERSKTFLEALQTRVNSLTADAYNRDDPAQRAVVEKDRLKALAEMDRLKKDIADQTKAIAGIEDEARRANVPSGWLR